MNFVCNLQVPASGAKTATLAGSCGPETLAAKKTGPYGNVSGSNNVNSVTCNMSELLNAESSFETTATSTATGISTSLCVWARPLSYDKLSTLKIGSNVMYMSGFNLWPTGIATSLQYYGDSGIKNYTVVDSAVGLVLSGVAAAVLAISF